MRGSRTAQLRVRPPGLFAMAKYRSDLRSLGVGVKRGIVNNVAPDPGIGYARKIAGGRRDPEFLMSEHHERSAFASERQDPAADTEPNAT